MSDRRPIPHIHFTVQSGVYAAHEASARLMVGLEPLELDIKEAGTVELVMAEALNNIVEHGYPDPENGGPISVYCEHGNTGLNIKLVDKGLPMPNGQIPIGSVANTDVDLKDMPEGGFGWFIIKTLAKDVVYSRVNEVNLLDLRIAIALD